MLIFEILLEIKDLLTFDVDIGAEDQGVRQVDLRHDPDKPSLGQQLSYLIQLDRASSLSNNQFTPPEPQCWWLIRQVEPNTAEDRFR